ncbi:dynein regulatory complex subunit 7 [Pyxicephalus adspersus]
MEVLEENPGETTHVTDHMTEEELCNIQEDLSHITVIEGSRVQEPDAHWDYKSLPSSYSSHSKKEQTLLGLANNFLRQYSHLYPDRKPLFMCPLNECGLEKFVCTTLHPTLLPYCDLYDWEECARFLAEYLSMEPINPPTELPRQLFSSSSVLQRQKGNCFDFSILLCSLLLGAGYDVYCVSGYASREICLMDQSREVCPLLKKTQESSEESPKNPHKKYSVTPPRQLVSRFELQQEAKRQTKLHALHLKEQEEKDRCQEDAEKSGPDPLFGLRVHCWVLVLSGKREVPENFFIDALTGNAYSTKDERFLGIESVWNHENYWVNMQDCRNGCKDMTFDLGDPVYWEFMLVGILRPLLLIPDMEEEEDVEEGDSENQDSSMMFQMPPSWTLPIVLTPKVHIYRSHAPETERTMLFYSTARLDGLERRDEKPNKMIETFQGRPDFLYYRLTLFGKRPKKVAIAGGPIEANPRPILKITERFSRNAEKPANEDVAERIFLITKDRIYVRYHRQDDRITTSYWEFQKPANLGKKGIHTDLSPETCISYQVEPCDKFTKQLYVYETLIHLQQVELIAKEAVRKAEAEVLEILSIRAQEELRSQLTISIYDTERNKKRKEQREAMERAAREDRLRCAMQELDYLAPFLARLGDPEKVTCAQAQQVKEDCLSDLKQRLIEKANLIQARFEKETQELQKKQQWYQENQNSMTQEDQDTYMDYCSEAMFRIQILETRLNRHKELAQHKYLALEDRLSKDPRLCEGLLSAQSGCS